MSGAETIFDRRARRVAGACGWAAIAIAALVLLGWAVDSTLLMRISADLPSMKPIAAIGVIALGSGIVLLAPRERSGSRERAGIAGGALAALVGVAVLADHALGGAGIDVLPLTGEGPDSGRPAPLAGAGLVLAGLALVTVDRGAPRYGLSLSLQAAAGLLVLVALVGFAYDVDYLRGRTDTAGISLQGTFALALALLAISLARPDRGAAAYLGRDEPAARLARTLIPVAIVVPIAFGALRLAGERAGLFGDEVGLALVTLGSMAILLAVIVVSVRDLRHQAARGDVGEGSFRAVSEAALEAIVTANRLGRITYVNPSAERMFGYEASELVGTELKTLMPERFRARHQAGLERFLRTGERRVIGDTIELVALRKGGEEFPISLSLVDWEVDGEVFFTGTVTDISRRKAAERRLADAARHFEMINDLIATCGFDGYFKRLNGAWEQTLGWKPEELLPDPFIEIVHDDDRDAVEQEVAKLAGGETTAGFKVRVATKDGAWRWTEWSATPDLEAGVFHCAGREITERIAAERALADERRQLADAQQLASVGSWELDVVTGERTWSAQQFRNHGFDPDGPLPSFEQVLERIHPDDQVRVLRLMAEIEAENYEFAYTYRVILPDGRVREIEAEGRPFIDASGATRVMGTTRDVTAERDAERAKDDFFGLVSHELRTPLTSIIGYTELLAEIEGERLSEQGRRFVEVIERNSRRELSLVGDLLLLTRITAGTFEVELGRADLAALTRASAESIRPDADKEGVEIALDVDRAPVIRADPHRLGQVFENLLSNAVKFTPRGGRVEVTAARDGGVAVISVSDTGIGIPAEDAERLFERMFRTTEARRRHIPGIGLGLTIVKAIVDAHHGTISVDSEPGEGTTFRVELPVGVADAESPAPVSADGERLPLGAEDD